MKNFKKLNIKNTLIALACTLVFAQANAMADPAEKFPLLNLPDFVILNELLPHLSNNDIASTAQTCKRLNTLVNHDTIKKFVQTRKLNEIIPLMDQFLTFDAQGNILNSLDKGLEEYVDQVNETLIIKNKRLEARNKFKNPNFTQKEFLILEQGLSNAENQMPFLKIKFLQFAIEHDTPLVLDFFIQNLPQHFVNLTELINKAEEEDAPECLSYLSKKSAEARSKSKRRIDEVCGYIPLQDQEKRQN